MKTIWITSFVIINIINLSSAKNDYSTKTKIVINNTKITTDRPNKEIITNRRKAFLVTFKPPINYKHEYSRIRKEYLKRKDTFLRHRASLLKVFKPKLKRKYHLKTKSNEDISKVKVKSSEENKSKEITSVVCKGIDVKNILNGTDNIAKNSDFLTNIHKNKYNRLKDLKRLRKCLSKLKKAERSSERKNKGRNFNIVDKKTLEELRHIIEVLDNFQKDKGREDILYESSLKLNANVTIKPEGNIKEPQTIVRSKRKVNIIEEEHSATTSSGFKFTGQDLSFHHFTYKNIHY